MNDMTDAQISKALALAIGWRESDLFPYGDGSYVAVRFESHWRTFDYTNEQIIWRVAERFDCFPSKWDEDGPFQWMACCEMSSHVSRADTAAKAVALAVIAAHGG